MDVRLRQNGSIMGESDFRVFLLANDGPTYDTLTPEVADDVGADLVHIRTPPHTTYGQVACLDGVECVDGVWYQKYVIMGVNDVPAEMLSSQWELMRAERNSKLAATDWTQLADTLTPELTKKYAEYRSALRNVTSAKSPSDVVWPEDPAKGA